MATPTITTPNTVRKSSSFGGFRKHRGLLIMMIPCVLFFLIFSYFPMYGIIIAFKDFNMRQGILGSPWNGWENFARLFSSEDFSRALRNTILISLLRFTFGFAAPIVLALMLNELRLVLYKRTIQTLTYLPFFLSWVLLGGMFLMLFANGGPINQGLTSLLGLHKPVEFLTNGPWFIATIVVTGIWQSAGYGAVIYLSALSGINPEIYEAAMIDGASRWKQTLHVTLPGLMPTMVVLFILSLNDFLSAGFDQIYNMYNPMVYNVSDIIDTYVLRRLTTTDFSLATAAGLFKSIVGLSLIILVNTIARRTSDGEQGVW
jgi:putative aldouronate transport system permease protein